MKKEDAFNISLPKWPQCIINGDKITKEQALEIIRRTDDFFFGYSGNNHSFNKAAKKICRIPNYEDFKNEDTYDWESYDKKYKEFHNTWNTVATEYISNSWISCCWIGGVHGWCHPDGTIAFCNNIGKWPSVEDVYNDLQILARAFPFLKLTCTLMSGEEGEDYTESLVSFSMVNGRVYIKNPIPKNKLILNGVRYNYYAMGKENYFDITEIKAWADKVYGEDPLWECLNN